MNVTGISAKIHPEILQGASFPGDKFKDATFASYLEKSISKANELLNAADVQGKEMAVGKSESVHETMVALEKADTALKLMVQVRNKALEAYNQILQMQV